jgi:hypothetical protein
MHTFPIMSLIITMAFASTVNAESPPILESMLYATTAPGDTSAVAVEVEVGAPAIDFGATLPKSLKLVAFQLFARRGTVEPTKPGDWTACPPVSGRYTCGNLPIGFTAPTVTKSDGGWTYQTQVQKANPAAAFRARMVLLFANAR